ncbi:50S ribosomal protein L10 [Parvicella tangerina]|uniref:Large ribosomal subunit protein uL10 n=1 Tax=Parvicella tangerina TaxID=2829795 RepID=A0A916JQS5_9FLAO|nr:50S ribosomal protein L10 [Parvicella tangerina]CAG5085204.1 50S ribosomal protein L10 [Parvicella tangerina]
MNRVEKQQAIDAIAETLSDANVFYLADASSMDASNTSNLRRQCFNKNIQMTVVKNKLLQKAMEKIEGKDYSEMYSVLAGPTAIMIAEVGNAPAKLIKEFRKKSDRPILKAAYIDESIYIGDDQLEALSNIKSKEELLGEIVTLLQSPAKNVVSALKSGGSTIAGLVKTLSEREN